MPAFKRWYDFHHSPLTVDSPPVRPWDIDRKCWQFIVIFDFHIFFCNIAGRRSVDKWVKEEWSWCSQNDHQEANLWICVQWRRRKSRGVVCKETEQREICSGPISGKSKSVHMTLKKVMTLTLYWYILLINRFEFYCKFDNLNNKRNGFFFEELSSFSKTNRMSKDCQPLMLKPLFILWWVTFLQNQKGAENC